MPATAAIKRQLPAVAPRPRQRRCRSPTTSSTRKGAGPPKSLWHGDAVRQAKVDLLSHFRRSEDVLVDMELRVYCERGNNTAHLQPDLQVVFGVGRERNWSSFKVWEEGRSPDFVLDGSVAVDGGVRRDRRARILAAGSGRVPDGKSPGRLRGERGGATVRWKLWGKREAAAGCGARCWTWIWAAGGGTGRRWWSSATRGRGRSSTAVWSEAQHLRRLRRIAEERARDAEERAQRQADMRHVAEERGAGTGGTASEVRSSRPTGSVGTSR